MQTIESRNTVAISTRVWRDVVQLGVEAVAIGVVFSVLLALAVYVVAKVDRSADFSTQPAAATVALAPQ